MSSSSAIIWLLTLLFITNRVACQFTIQLFVRPNNNGVTSIRNCTTVDNACSSIQQSLVFLDSILPTLNQTTIMMDIVLLASIDQYQDDCTSAILYAKTDLFSFHIRVMSAEGTRQVITCSTDNYAPLLRLRKDFKKLTFMNLDMRKVKLSGDGVPGNVLFYNCSISACNFKFEQGASVEGQYYVKFEKTQDRNSIFWFTQVDFVTFKDVILEGTLLDVRDYNTATFQNSALRNCYINVLGGSYLYLYTSTVNATTLIFTHFIAVMVDFTQFFNQGLLATNFGQFLSFLSCQVYGMDHWLRSKGVSTITFDDTVVRDNDENRLKKSDGIVEIISTMFIGIRKSKFTNNGNRALFIDETSGLQIYLSEFHNNHGGAVYLQKVANFFTVGLERDTKVMSCKFTNNYSTGKGAALHIPRNVPSLISDSVFRNNSAENGGAVFCAASNIEVVSCVFDRNRAIPVSNECSDCTGNGGALVIENPTGNVSVIRSNFTQNEAKRGGAIHISIDAYPESFLLSNTSRCENNLASFSGGCLFANQSISKFPFINIQGSSQSLVDGDFVGTSLIYYRNWTITHQASGEISKELQVYPGEVVTISLVLVDYFGNNITNQENEITFSHGDSLSFGYKLAENNLKLVEFFVSLNTNSTEFDGMRTNATIHIPGVTDSEFQLTLLQCPPYTKLQNVTLSNRMTCQPVILWQAIIPAIIIGILVFFAIGLASGTGIFYCSWKTMKNLKKLKKKELAEKELEMKLLNKKMIFSDDGNSELSTSLLSSYHHENKIDISKSFIIPVEDIDIVKKIGEGANGTVYLARWRGTEVAIKSLKLSENSEEESEEFETEASLLSSLRHPAIVSFYGVAMSSSTKYMVVEYLTGSLDKAIYNSRMGKNTFRMKEKLNILLGVASGMNYLHSLKPMSIIHRDLKPGNILLDKQLNGKVCDFGLSKMVNVQATLQSMTMNLGTLLYMAPEILGDSGHAYSTKVDVFSFGIIMYELFFEETPYLNNSEKINRFSNQESAQNCFNIPSRVLNGLRPAIPFSNDEEQAIWLQEYVLPREDGVSLQAMMQLTDAYLNLTKMCWSGNYQERPSFTTISERLSEMTERFLDGGVK